MVSRGPCPNWRSGVVDRGDSSELRAVISCQHARPVGHEAEGPSSGLGQRPEDRALAAKDNRVDSQIRPTGVIEVVVRTWLKWVFSRPGPQEPEKGLPGPSEENPNRPLVGERLRTCVENRKFRLSVVGPNCEPRLLGKRLWGLTVRREFSGSVVGP